MSAFQAAETSSNLVSRSNMYQFTFRYTNGEVITKIFASAQSGIAWAHAEGDHLLEYNYVNI